MINTRNRLRPFSTLLFTVMLAGAWACKSSETPNTAFVEAGIFKVAILYPNSDTTQFDMEYYKGKHMPMVAGYLGDNLVFYEIDRGIAGRSPGDKAAYMAVGYFFVKDVDLYNAAIAKNREAIISDIRNYTNVQPVIQISEVKLVVKNR